MYEDPMDDPLVKPLVDALRVIALTPHIVEYLATHDRTALAQVQKALAPFEEKS
jgi:hypothetical protein